MPIKSKEDRAAYDRAYRATNAGRKAAYEAQEAKAMQDAMPDVFSDFSF